MPETCQVSKLKLGVKKCSNQDIAITVDENNMKIPVCRACWVKISTKDKFYKKVDAL